VLHDVNLEIPLASPCLRWSTGAGKSTMAKLANRFYDPTVGRVLLDGIDIRTSPSFASLTGSGRTPEPSSCGVHPHQPELATPKRPRSRSTPRHVVGLRDLVDRLPQGLTHRCTSVADAFRPASASSSRWRGPSLRDPRAILDEATSSVDLQARR